MSGPASQRAEESVLGAVLRDEETRIEVIASMLEPEHFHFRPYRIAYEEVVERYYADDTIDALTVAEAVSKRVAPMLKVDEREAVDKIVALAQPTGADTTTVTEHAKVIKRHADYRELMSLTQRAQQAIGEESMDPDQIAGALSVAATKVATNNARVLETFSYLSLGRRWVERTKREIAARQAGVELGVFFGIRGIDAITKGLRPTELMILGGEPGVGKSGLAWVMAENFAKRQMRKPEDQRVGTLVASLEMGEDPSSTRLAMSVSRVDGERLRLGTLTGTELMDAARQWAGQKDLPLHFNHSGRLRQSQLKAVIVEAIRKFNVGLVVIDHFRFIQTDEKFVNSAEADDEIVLFLKSSLAKELNIAVVCLAHTIKTIERADKRPRMSDLRGSGMISAFADFIAFLYHPWMYATKKQQNEGLVSREDYEVIFEKARHSAKDVGEVYMDLSTMQIH